MDDQFWKVSNKVDYTLATMMEIIQECERLGLEDKSVVKSALELYNFWKDNKQGKVKCQD
jgi:hypothetical protein